ncbi:Hypothetical protein R9X50_00297800 [Acrodontium crateriforme]|uniref:Diaminopimelate epimerase-like protein n=1 Tax=Acrodontium crateriforme TaxID=150365 RepID=A0AAQ3M3I8_9PEZI|nr:Hypothetical protein R9X50_00297800 [Acrodontium crateriforme]
MPSLSFVTVDVFTTTRYAGNPLAIINVPKGHDISDDQMQQIAREFNLSESVFLHESIASDNGVPEWRIRIFMTTAELPFAGHPTIGTACYALGSIAHNAPKGRLIANAGPIDVDFASDVARAAIPHNVHVHTENPFTIHDVYKLQPALVGVSSRAIDIVSPVKGMNFVCVELPDLATLAKIDNTGVKPQPRLDEAWNVGFAGSLFYVLTDGPVTDDKVVKVRTRMMEGNFEDPATGSAACALGAHLALKARSKSVHFDVTQGVEIGRKSDIGVSVVLKEGLDEVESIELSGSAVKIMEGVIEY